MCRFYSPKVSQRTIFCAVSRSHSLSLLEVKTVSVFSHPYGCVCYAFILSQSLSYLDAPKKSGALNLSLLSSSIFAQHILMTLFSHPDCFLRTTFSPLAVCFNFLFSLSLSRSVFLLLCFLASIFFRRASLLILSCLSLIWTWCMNVGCVCVREMQYVFYFYRICTICLHANKKKKKRRRVNKKLRERNFFPHQRCCWFLLISQFIVMGTNLTVSWPSRFYKNTFCTMNISQKRKTENETLSNGFRVAENIQIHIFYGY